MVTKQQALRIGGREWGDRVYFNDWPEWIGLEISKYNTGNVSSARLGNVALSNTLGTLLANVKVYWQSGHIHTTFARVPALGNKLGRLGVDVAVLEREIREHVSRKVEETPSDG